MQSRTFVPKREDNKAYREAVWRSARQTHFVDSVSGQSTAGDQPVKTHAKVSEKLDVKAHATSFLLLFEFKFTGTKLVAYRGSTSWVILESDVQKFCAAWDHEIVTSTYSDA